MSNIAIFCFTTFCVDLPVNSSHEMVQSTFELHNLEKSIDFSKEWLKYFKDKLEFISKRDVIDILKNALADATSKHTEPALKAVRDAVSAANNKGSIPFHCYTIAWQEINDAIRNKYNFDIVPCIANFTNAFQKIWQGIELLREEIKRTQQYFNETVPSCYNFTDAAGCLNTTLWTIKDARTRVEKLINLLLSKKETFYPRLKKDSKTCSTAYVKSVKDASSLAQREGIRCVETNETPIHQST